MAGKEDDAYGYIPVDDDGDTMLNVVEGMRLKQARCFDLITTRTIVKQLNMQFPSQWGRHPAIANWWLWRIAFSHIV